MEPEEQSLSSTAGPSMLEIRRRMGDANAAYVAAYGEEKLPVNPRLKLAVVTCVDCRLTARLDEALGLQPGDAVVIRIAGSTFGGTDDVTRSLAVAIFSQGVRNILVVGHTHCGVARIDPLLFEEEMARRGVSRMSVGIIPLRDWLGIFAGEALNVREMVRKLRLAPLIPNDVEIAGALFDTETAELTWLEA